MATVALGSLPTSLAVAAEPPARARAASQVPTSPAARSTGSPAAFAGVPSRGPTSATATRTRARTIRPTPPRRGAAVKDIPANSTAGRRSPLPAVIEPTAKRPKSANVREPLPRSYRPACRVVPAGALSAGSADHIDFSDQPSFGGWRVARGPGREEAGVPLA